MHIHLQMLPKYKADTKSTVIFYLQYDIAFDDQHMDNTDLNMY